MQQSCVPSFPLEQGGGCAGKVDERHTSCSSEKNECITLPLQRTWTPSESLGSMQTQLLLSLQTRLFQFLPVSFYYFILNPMLGELRIHLTGNVWGNASRATCSMFRRGGSFHCLAGDVKGTAHSGGRMFAVSGAAARAFCKLPSEWTAGEKTEVPRFNG